MEKSKIEWCDSTWNPVTGCYHDCPYCYARGTANRFKGCDAAPSGETDKRIVQISKRMQVTTKDGKVMNAAYPYGFTPTFHEYRISDLDTKKFGETIFVCSMADLFGEWVPDEWIERILSRCKENSDHRYLFLTKNPERYVRIADSFSPAGLPSGTNFWYGVTATTEEKAIEASCIIDKLPYGYKSFLSIEPISGPIRVNEWDWIGSFDWVIIGAETGNRSSKIVPERSWVDHIVASCAARGVPVFMKDSLIPIWGEDLITEFPWDK